MVKKIGSALSMSRGPVIPGRVSERKIERESGDPPFGSVILMSPGIGWVLSNLFLLVSYQYYCCVGVGAGRSPVGCAERSNLL